jgi:hypothetical protein
MFMVTLAADLRGVYVDRVIIGAPVSIVPRAIF